MSASSALAVAAAKPSTYQNPFGLKTGGNVFGPNNTMTPDGGPITPSRTPVGQTQTSPTQTPVIPIPTTPATTPGAAGAPTATANLAFDLQTDPALQQVNALAGLSDQQANAAALQQRQQQLIQYGDPKLAAAVLGQNDPTVQAAGQNQESDLAMLKRQYGQNLQDFETQLDPSLTFSGYKIGQEQKLGQAYQDALAQAAAGVQNSLGSITGGLNAALQQNATNRENALGTAEANQLALILAGLGGGTATSGGTTDYPPGVTGVYGPGVPGPSGGGNTQFQTLSPLQQAVLAGQMPGGRATILPPIAS